MYISFLAQSELPEEIVDDEDDESEEENHQDPKMHPAVHLLMVFVVLWGFVFQISNTALNALVHFLHHFLRIIASCSLNHTEVQMISQQCPKSLPTVQRLLGLNSDDFVQYVVCPKCDSVYELEAYIGRGPNGEAVSKQCIHVEFPNHTVHTRRKECGLSYFKRFLEAVEHSSDHLRYMHITLLFQL